MINKIDGNNYESYNYQMWFFIIICAIANNFKCQDNFKWRRETLHHKNFQMVSISRKVRTDGRTW